MMQPKQKINNLRDEDIKKLHRSFIPDELIMSSDIYRVDSNGGAELVGRKPNANTNYAGIVFTYFFPTNKQKTQYRVRLDDPQDKGGKYLTFAGTRNSLYFIPGVSAEDLKNPHLPIVLTEGEKKALALENLATYKTDTRRFVPVGISGVWNWKGKVAKNKKGVIPDFKQIELKHREVILIFDSDVATNKLVLAARNALAEWLTTQGARVFTVDIPITEGNKLGIDDLLGQWQSESDTATAVRNGLDLLSTKQPFIVGQLKEILLDGALTLEAEADTRGKLKITARDAKNDVIFIDSFNPSDALKRAKFAKSLGFDNFQIDIARVLLKFADLAESISNHNSAKPNGETVETSFEKLNDGRIIEQISDLRFAVYNKENDSIEIVDTVTDKETGKIYNPIDDDLLKMEIGGIYLANDVSEYGTKKELIEAIKAYVNKYVDLQPLYLALVSYYILFTYLFDKVLELSYVSATGDLGSGKSRLGMTIALASYRGFMMTNPTAATLFRVVDRFTPTLFIDEFNSDANSDDTQAIIQVLNTGFSTLGSISRQVKGADGNFKTETFNPYCPKIIGSYKASASDALKSRNIEIEMERSFRNDLPIRLTHNFLNEAQALRNKLIKFRLNEFEKDLEAKLDKAELDLRSAGITPRSVQINIPLYALIDDAELKAEFVALLQDRDKILTESKIQSIDGEIVEAIHSFIFNIELDDDGNEIAEWKIKPKPKNLKLCSKIPIPELTAKLNNSREDYKNLTPQYIGRKLTALGLRTKKNWSRDDEEMRGKSALFFDYQRLKILFDNFNLPYSSDFVVAIVAKPSNSNNDNGLYVATTNFNSENKKTMVATTNTTKQTTYANGNNGNNEFQDIETENKNDREKLEI